MPVRLRECNKRFANAESVRDGFGFIERWLRTSFNRSPQVRSVDTALDLIKTFGMRDPLLEPKNKRERKRWNYFKIGMTGQVPWNSRGIEECLRHMHQRRSEMTVEQQKNYDAYIVALSFIKEKYGRNKGTLYFQRMGSIITFMRHYRERLKKDKFITTDKRGNTFWDDNLMEAFARLPFTMESFKYDDVKNYIERCKKPS